MNSNIKRYIDNLTKHSTVAEIMENLLVDYKSEIIDKAFHRLITSDNLSKFRPGIIASLSAKLEDDKYIEKAATEISELDEIPLDVGRERVFDIISSIIDAINNMDNIIDEIIKRSTKYQRSAVNRAKFLLTAKEDTQGQIREVLEFLNNQVQEDEKELNSIYEIEYLNDMLIYLCWSYR